MRIQVKSFMSTPVTTAVGKESIQTIRGLMKRNNIHAIPIVEYTKQLPKAEVRIRGIVTSTDLNQGLDDSLPVETIMTPNVHVTHQDSNAKSAAKMMLKNKIHHLVVMDSGKIVGLISSLDFVKLVAQYELD